MKKISRRMALKTGIVAGIAAAAKASDAASILQVDHPTPSEIKGPFYPVVAQKDKDFDLTVVDGRSTAAKGEAIVLDVRVVDTVGKGVSDATVDIWQACASGKYSHPHDPNPAEPDPNFQGWAIVPSGENGSLRFKTIMPGAYPAAREWTRPPHIHFKVSKRGYVELVTQMYFPGHPLNTDDRLLNRKSDAEQTLMIAKHVSDTPKTFHYRIVLQKA
ncbi:MAG: protocatechuate 3,4-dioxygenase [Kiritimatiellae bacterium]|nr:protocatechuate 3,4-dioxygenase [Kiritimatiellia bacterium]